MPFNYIILQIHHCKGCLTGLYCIVDLVGHKTISVNNCSDLLMVNTLSVSMWKLLFLQIQIRLNTAVKESRRVLYSKKKLKQKKSDALIMQQQFESIHKSAHNRVFNSTWLQKSFYGTACFQSKTNQVFLMFNSPNTWVHFWLMLD